MTIDPSGQEQAIAAEVADAAARRMPLAIVGGGTKRAMGRPAQAEREIATGALSGVTLHEPAEMVISALAGTPVAEVEAALDAKGQMLAFEPPDYCALLASSGVPTIGAVVAMNRSGPRRIQAGACRDALIGVRYVNGRGEVLRAGGRVMKNVTGLDVVKLQAGAWGTLGLLTEATFRVLPKPETQVTVMLRGLDDAAGVAALAAALGSPFEVSGAAHVPAPLEAKPVTAVRIEGFEASVRYRAGEIVRLWRERGASDLIVGAAAEPFWSGLRDMTLLAEPRGRPIWRISLRPTGGPALVAALRAGGLAFDCVYDWGGGLVWLAAEADDRACAATIREELARAGGGHATLVRAPTDVRAAIDVFQPLAPALQALQRRVKTALDPAGILNPGRMYAGL